MGKKSFKIGDDVHVADGIRGIVVDYRPLPTGVVAYGIMNADGLIEYHAAFAVQSSEGKNGNPMEPH